MLVLITCKYEKGPIINSRENVMTYFPHYKHMEFFQTLNGNSLRCPWSDLAVHALMYVILTCKYEMIRSKTVEKM